MAIEKNSGSWNEIGANACVARSAPGLCMAGGNAFSYCVRRRSSRSVRRHWRRAHGQQGGATGWRRCSPMPTRRALSAGPGALPSVHARTSVCMASLGDRASRRCRDAGARAIRCDGSCRSPFPAWARDGKPERQAQPRSRGSASCVGELPDPPQSRFDFESAALFRPNSWPSSLLRPQCLLIACEASTRAGRRDSFTGAHLVSKNGFVLVCRSVGGAAGDAGLRPSCPESELARGRAADCLR